MLAADWLIQTLYRNATAPIRPTISAAKAATILTEPAAAPLWAGAEVPELGADEVPEGTAVEEPVAAEAELVPEPLDVARVLLPPAPVSVGRVTTEPEGAPAGALVPGRVSVTGATLLTVGTDAAGVTWIWPSEYCETGARDEVGAAEVLMLAQGVVPT